MPDSCKSLLGITSDGTHYRVKMHHWNASMIILLYEARLTYTAIKLRSARRDVTSLKRFPSLRCDPGVKQIQVIFITNDDHADSDHT